MLKSHIQNKSAEQWFQSGKEKQIPEYMKKALILKNKNPEYYMEKSRVELSQGKVEDSLQTLDNLEKVYPQDQEALKQKGILLYKQKKYEEALECFDKILTINEEYAEIHFDKGIIYDVLHKKDQAYECYQKALSHKEDFPEALNNIGKHLFDQGVFKEALKNFDKALKLKKNYAEAYFNKGILFVQIQKKQQALECFDKAIKYKKNFSEAYFNRALLVLEIRNVEEAIVNLKMATQNNSFYYQAYFNLGLIYLKKKRIYQVAMEFFDKTIEINNQYYKAFNYKGEALIQQNKFKEAQENFELCLKINKNYIEALSNLAFCYNMKQNYQESLRIYDEILNFNKDAYWILYHKAMVLKKMGKPYLNYLNQIIEIQPDYLMAYFQKGNWFLEQGEEKILEAEQNFETSIKIKQEFHEGYFGIAKIKLRQQLFQESYEFIKKALRYNMSNPAYYTIKGVCLIKMGQINKALDEFKQSLFLSKKKNSKEVMEKVINFYQQIQFIQAFDQSGSTKKQVTNNLIKFNNLFFEETIKNKSKVILENNSSLLEENSKDFLKLIEGLFATNNKIYQEIEQKQIQIENSNQMKKSFVIEPEEQYKKGFLFLMTKCFQIAQVYNCKLIKLEEKQFLQEIFIEKQDFLYFLADSIFLDKPQNSQQKNSTKITNFNDFSLKSQILIEWGIDLLLYTEKIENLVQNIVKKFSNQIQNYKVEITNNMEKNALNFCKQYQEFTQKIHLIDEILKQNHFYKQGIKHAIIILKQYFYSNKVNQEKLPIQKIAELFCSDYIFEFN